MRTRRPLLVGPVFHGYTTSIADALRRAGHVVDVHHYDAHEGVADRLRTKLGTELPRLVGLRGDARRVARHRTASRSTPCAAPPPRPRPWRSRPTSWTPASGRRRGGRRRHAPLALRRAAPDGPRPRRPPGRRRPHSYSALDTAELAARGCPRPTWPTATTRTGPSCRDRRATCCSSGPVPNREALLVALHQRGLPVRAVGRDWSHHPVDRLRTWDVRRPPPPRGPRRRPHHELRARGGGAAANLNIHHDQDGFTMRTFEIPAPGGSSWSTARTSPSSTSRAPRSSCTATPTRPPSSPGGRCATRRGPGRWRRRDGSGRWPTTPWTTGSASWRRCGGPTHPRDLEAWHRWHHGAQPLTRRVRRSLDVLRDIARPDGRAERVAVTRGGPRCRVLVLVEARTPSQLQPVVAPLRTSRSTTSSWSRRCRSVTPCRRGCGRSRGRSRTRRCPSSRAAPRSSSRPATSSGSGASAGMPSPTRRASSPCSTGCSRRTLPRSPRARRCRVVRRRRRVLALGPGRRDDAGRGVPAPVGGGPRAGRAPDPGARPVFLGQLHGVELPRALVTEAAESFCRVQGPSTGPTPPRPTAAPGRPTSGGRPRASPSTGRDAPARARGTRRQRLLHRGRRGRGRGPAGWVHCPSAPAVARGVLGRYHLARWGPGRRHPPNGPPWSRRVRSPEPLRG